jgi:hypothetical protein
MKSLLAAALVIVGLASACWADEVRFPLTVDHEVLQAALRQHLRQQGGGELELWRTADGCGSFRLREVTIGAADAGRVKIAGPASGTASLALFGFCWGTISWTGYAEIVARPEIGADWQLRLQHVEAEFYDPTRKQRGLARRLWTVASGWVEAELATFTFDLGPPIGELTALLTAFSTGNNALVQTLRTIRPAGVTVRADAIEVGLAADVPPATAVPSAPEPALTPAELARWEARLDGWDGFLSFVVKDLAGDNADPAVRDALLAILLDGRRQVVALLGRGPEPGTDAVRKIFLHTWANLRTIVRRTAIQQQDVPHAFRYVTFLAAGDALTALDAVAPAVGLDFSADGLRRLARSLDPEFAGDPLQQSDLPDPSLQQLFRFRDPDAPPRRPRRKPAGSSWHWFGPRPAYASAEEEEWHELAARLDRWVPTRHELADYRASVDRLLWVAADRSLDPDVLDERFDDLFHHLVKATAWQESCWRQFVHRSGLVTYLESSTGDVGLMQINIRVWRGFFNAMKLRWNAAYNAGAGAEILHHLLVRYGTREAREGLENAARASYSAYNGGPARYRRYRMAAPASRVAAVDRAFWEKYRAVAAGTAEDHVLCLRPRHTS